MTPRDPVEREAQLGALVAAAMRHLVDRPDLEAHLGELDGDRVGAVLLDVAERLRDELPYHHPLYAGQMIAPPHPVARGAYALAQWVNPNNHAYDGGRASSDMEKEAVAELASVFGWSDALGHLCSGGTVANLEALWVASRLQPGRRIVASAAAHYTHERLCGVLGVPFTAIDADRHGRMDLGALDAALGAGDVGTVVVTAGTTALGAVDPLPEVLARRHRHGFRVHVDAAYGGYFALSSLLDDQVAAAFARLRDADSIVVDPHKHGLQPYGCGCVLFRDPGVGRLYRHESPYTYFTSAELHLGEITLECSRPGAAAVALWATQRLLPLERGGAFAAGIDRCRAAALRLHDRMAAMPGVVPVVGPDLDIVVFAVEAPTASVASARARALFEEAARDGLHLALAEVDPIVAGPALPDMVWDRPTLTCVRSCLLKREHLDWVDRISDLVATALERVVAAEADRRR